MHDDLYQYLTTEDGIAALFPGGIHHMSLPQNVDEWPAMSFQLSSQIEVAPDMEAPNDEKIDQVNYSFAITDPQSAPSITASDAFNTIFRNFRGMMGTTNIQNIDVGNVSHLEERIGDKLRRRVVSDFSIFFDV